MHLNDSAVEMHCNKVSRQLTSLTDDQGRRVEIGLDSNGLLYPVASNQVFDTSSGTAQCGS